jgi:hypothetical protein
VTSNLAVANDNTGISLEGAAVIKGNDASSNKVGIGGRILPVVPPVVPAVPPMAVTTPVVPLVVVFWVGRSQDWSGQASVAQATSAHPDSQAVPLQEQA